MDILFVRCFFFRIKETVFFGSGHRRLDKLLCVAEGSIIWIGTWIGMALAAIAFQEPEALMILLLQSCPSCRRSHTIVTLLFPMTRMRRDIFASVTRNSDTRNTPVVSLVRLTVRVSVMLMTGRWDRRHGQEQALADC